MTSTRNVIKKKFRKACASRLERDRDANRALQPLTTAATTVTTSLSSSPLPPPPPTITNESESKNNTMQLGLAINSYSQRNVNNTNDPNELCAKLRLLLNSKNGDSLHRTREISSIVNKLHGLEIIL